MSSGDLVYPDPPGTNDAGFVRLREIEAERPQDELRFVLLSLNYGWALVFFFFFKLSSLYYRMNLDPYTLYLNPHILSHICVLSLGRIFVTDGYSLDRHVLSHAVDEAQYLTRSRQAHVDKSNISPSPGFIHEKCNFCVFGATLGSKEWINAIQDPQGILVPEDIRSYRMELEPDLLTATRRPDIML